MRPYAAMIVISHRVLGSEIVFNSPYRENTGINRRKSTTKIDSEKRERKTTAKMNGKQRKRPWHPPAACDKQKYEAHVTTRTDDH